jgi:hypothetical protein
LVGLFDWFDWLYEAMNENHQPIKPIKPKTIFGKIMQIDKKTVAAIAAVMSYLKTEEEIFAMQAVSAPAASRAAAPISINLWGISGRQAMMQMRNMMQMKIFK